MAEIVTSVLLTVEPDLGHASGGRGIWNQYHVSHPSGTMLVCVHA
ncbi:hypothetical protein EMIT07CA2_120034 [Brevibacillus sp. IT-7CA2]